MREYKSILIKKEVYDKIVDLMYKERHKNISQTVSFIIEKYLESQKEN